MKKPFLALLIVLIPFLMIAVYNVGYSAGIKEVKQTEETKEEAVYLMQGEITNRYFEYIGNPATIGEQCKFECVVFGEKNCTYN